MAFTIMNQMAKPGPDLYYDPKFRLIIETHMNLLRKVDVTYEAIPPELFYQYEGDFYGYLTERGISPELHFIYLRVNGMVNPDEFAKEIRDPLDREYRPVLIRPSLSMIETIKMYYASRKF